ncbi:replicative DNA helicase [[Acholeplasma] multilocale]|uniref:replicative DNA helicase n=1 Tax=[Acholeplasma] multilocale TaxID=264638 RepID=UPI000479C870|nr:replicative DNA helicase [[Acholeplasma] multilocale]
MEQQFETKNVVLDESEKIVLAIAMHSPNALPDILMRLTADDFYFGAHKLIYSAIQSLNEDSREISSTTIALLLEEKKQLGQAGGPELINAVSGYFYTDEGVEDYIDIVFRASMARKFDATLLQIQELRKTNPNLTEVLDQAQRDLLEIDLDAKKSDVISIGGSVKDVIAKIRDLEQRDATLTGVTTGFSKLDKITSGLQPSDFIILAARPSMGKTAFALNLAYNAATQGDNGVAIFSVEMPAEQLTQRILSTMTSIESTKLRTGKNLDRQNWIDITSANDRLQSTHIYIDDTPGVTVQQIQSKLHKLKRDHNITLCVIDYLQLITTPGSNGSDRQNEISNISRQLKRIARDTGVSIVCLSQLSRSVEKREDKRPIMSDLRDSGAIEQDADIIMFLYRPEYYQNKTADELIADPISETELIIAKHRNGSTGTVELSFNKAFGKFIDMN